MNIKDPNFRVLDPCAGTGVFLQIWYHILIQHHTKEYVLNNMLYACDISAYNCKILRALGIKNVYKEDFSF